MNERERRKRTITCQIHHGHGIVQVAGDCCLLRLILGAYETLGVQYKGSFERVIWQQVALILQRSIASRFEATIVVTRT